MAAPPNEKLEVLRIVGLCVLAAILYGIVHDLVTAHVCVEYFTIGHPPVFGTENPVLLALGWGVIATWWVGFLLGWPLAFAAIRGPRPRRTAQSLAPAIGKLLIAMAAISAVAGIVGYVLAEAGAVVLFGHIAEALPRDRHAVFIADLWAHSASYAVGFVGGIVLVVRTWRSRRTQRDLAAARG